MWNRKKKISFSVNGKVSNGQWVVNPVNHLSEIKFFSLL